MTMKLVRPSTTAEKQSRTTVDTVEITEKVIDSWLAPKFQRDLKPSGKAFDRVVQKIRDDDGVIPGVLTLGVFEGQVYRVDGQHRLAAFRKTGLPVGYADVRTVFCETWDEMAEEYELLQSSIQPMKPDDKLKAKEVSSPHLQRLRKRCPFIGYSMIRRNEKTPILSMSTALRCWCGSKPDAPVSSIAAVAAAEMLTDDEADNAIDFFLLCYEAWGRDDTYARLWGGMNLSLCAWLYRRVVLRENVSLRATKLTKDDFRKCLMALSADATFTDWLVGRKDRDRSPAYDRIKRLFQRRYLADVNKQAILPMPTWARG